MLKPYMLRPIKSPEDAVDFILKLYLDRKLWHFDEDPSNFVDNATGLPAFTDKQLEHLRERQLELFEHLNDPHELPLAILTNLQN